MRKLFIVSLLFLLIMSSTTNMYAMTDDEIGLPIQMLPWKEAKEHLPKFKKFTVLDVDTGKRFDVQRRAGREHADVQPLTAKDTKMMKEIYNGKWSWKRRAIIVISDGEWIAASMHGMPHGAGALANNFPGHFCIHFLGSTTHRTNSMDLSHKLMILKAAGKLDDYTAVADPEEVSAAFIAGLKQQDAYLLSLVTLSEVNEKTVRVIENVKLSSIGQSQVDNTSLTVHLPIEVDWFIKNKGRKSFRGSIRLVRFSPLDPWQVDAEDFLLKNHLKPQSK